MKILLEINDDKAIHLVEVLKGLPYVDIIPYAEEKSQLVSEITEAVDNLKLVRTGKLIAQPAEDLLNEL